MVKKNKNYVAKRPSLINSEVVLFCLVLLIAAAIVLSGCGRNEVSTLTGQPGAAGANGHSAVFASLSATQCINGGQVLLVALDTNDNGVLDPTDANIQSLTVCNGANGQNAVTSPAKLTPVEYVTPCPEITSAFREVLLLMADGSLLGSFSNNHAGDETRLSVLPDGSYVNTDNSSCGFNVLRTGNTRTMTWNTGSKSWGASY